MTSIQVDESEGYDSMEVNLDDWDQLNYNYDSNYIRDQTIQVSTNLQKIDSDNEVAPNIYDENEYGSDYDDFKDMDREINTQFPNTNLLQEYHNTESDDSNLSLLNKHIFNQQSEGDLFDDSLLIDGSNNYETAPRRSARLEKLRALNENNNWITNHYQQVTSGIISDEQKEINSNIGIVKDTAADQLSAIDKYRAMMAARNIDLNKLIGEYDIEPLVIKEHEYKRKDNLPPADIIDPNNLPQYILDLLNDEPNKVVIGYEQDNHTGATTTQLICKSI